MTNFNLNLPIDIPWRRIAVTEDMIDSEGGDREFPLRWQTSISIFDYQPGDDYQNYEGMIVSYLKISCSITGFQPRGDEVGLQHSDALVGSERLENGDYLIDPSRWEDSRVIKAYKQAIDDYYGCYGAILEVGVTPKDQSDDVSEEDFPFFIDFEPKKRELYEVVTETGEAMSRSLSGLNVRKGSTTTEAHEVLDIFGGASMQGSYAGTGGGASVQGQWGTRDLNQTEYVDMRTTDSAREKRESYSHTTQLSQLYHQLDSYHIGTNRALFYILPRPHIVQLSSDDPTEADRSTFVDGPRLLEGLQEFFLVVLRPERIEEICVDAYLETAHIFQEKIPEFRPAENLVDEFVVNGSLNERENQTERIENEEDAKSFLGRVYDAAGASTIGAIIGGPIGAAIGAVFGALWNEAFGDTLDKTTMTAITRRFTPGSVDLEFDLSRRNQAICTPIGEREQYLGCEILQETFNEQEVSCIASVYSQKFTENTFFFDTGTKRKYGKATIRVEVPQRHKDPVYVNGEKALFLTGRGVSTCTSSTPAYKPKPPSIVYEKGHLENIDIALSIGKPGVMPRAIANRIGEQVRRTLLQGRNDSNRKPRGVVAFAESDFFAKFVGKVIENSPKDRKAVLRLEGLDKEILESIQNKNLRLNRTDILNTDLRVLAARLDLDLDKVRHLRRVALGLLSAEEAEKIPDVDLAPRTEVPDIIGLSFAEGERALEDVGLRFGAREYVDDHVPRGYIRDQDPERGTMIPRGAAVSVKLSTGLSVRIPDIIGLTANDALVSLSRAGLRHPPMVYYSIVKDHKLEGRVLSVEPAPRSFVTPGEIVSLNVATCRDTPEVKEGVR